MNAPRTAAAVVLGAVAIALGIVAAVSAAPEAAVGSGLAGAAAALLAVHALAAGRALDERAGTLAEERRRLSREVDLLAGMLAEETTRARASAAGPAAPPATSGWVHDPGSGLLVEEILPVILSQRLAAARRHLEPMSVVVFQVDGFQDAEGDAREQSVGVLGDVVRQTLRESDLAFRFTGAMAIAILEDTAESGALWAAERVRGALHASALADTLTVSAGIASYPTHALDATELVERAVGALSAAREHGPDRVVIAPTD
ncbi:MAG: diguanylate cyclase [Acidimicrobiia bacterium]|nr:diguanylate cyclase [Acidimicrobiia bacterium]